MTHKSLLLSLLLITTLSCGQSVLVTTDPTPTASTIFLGGDLSYINELEDCGATYRSNGKVVDAYQLFKDRGANIVRLRLWHTPNWTTYSNFRDVKKSISRAKKLQMTVLLDFHYSDTWADPAHQTIPQAWEKITNIQILGDSLYNYTLNTLLALNKEGLLPEMVQVGNETNAEILQYTPNAKTTIDWTRNVALFNRGIEAVRKAADLTGKPIGTMLHIAQPDDALWWFTEAHKNGIANYDWIGLSYYPKWSKYDLAKLSEMMVTLKKNFAKRLMIVETGYPHTLKNVDAANNLLDAGLAGYDISPQGQLSFMTSLTQTTLNAGGEGIIYWEPAWVTSPCSTQWAKGSHWDNATFFDAFNANEALPVFNFLEAKQYKR